MSEIKVLVTGGGGFFGQPVCAELTKRKLPWVSIQTGGELRPLFSFLDLRDSKAVEEFLRRERPTHLLHLAWYVAHGKYWESLQNLDCMAMTLQLFRHFCENGGKRFVGVGTCAEYDWSLPGPFTEESFLNPQSVYGHIKKQTYEALKPIAERFHVSLGWARPFYPFGLGEPTQKIIPSLFSALQNQSPMTLSGISKKKDFIYIKDVALILVEFLLSDLKGSLNVSSGEGWTIRELALLAEKVVQKKGHFEWNLEKRGTEPDCLVGTPNRRLERLGVTLKYDIESGLKEYFQSWLRQ